MEAAVAWERDPVTVCLSGKRRNLGDEAEKLKKKIYHCDSDIK